MKKHFQPGFTMLVLIAILSILFVVPTALASPPLDVHIEVLATIDPAPDAFVASGPAVDVGLLCSTGYQYELSVETSGPPAGDFFMLKVVKQFVCDDGSGTFDLKLVVRLDLIDSSTTAHWNVLAGTGAYAGLHGNGDLVGIPLDPGVSIVDLYDGRIH
ncbi:MAG: hypothetical protein CL607_18115 [Anaerolineaceae bacterium]|nr:hypothetical protein [Anaerolineaceae bacterium]